MALDGLGKARVPTATERQARRDLDNSRQLSKWIRKSVRRTLAPVGRTGECGLYDYLCVCVCV